MLLYCIRFADIAPEKLCNLFLYKTGYDKNCQETPYGNLHKLKKEINRSSQADQSFTSI